MWSRRCSAPNTRAPPGSWSSRPRPGLLRRQHRDHRDSIRVRPRGAIRSTSTGWRHGTRHDVIGVGGSAVAGAVAFAPWHSAKPRRYGTDDSTTTSTTRHPRVGARPLTRCSPASRSAGPPPFPLVGPPRGHVRPGGEGAAHPAGAVGSAVSTTIDIIRRPLADASSRDESTVRPRRCCTHERVVADVATDVPVDASVYRLPPPGRAVHLALGTTPQDRAGRPSPSPPSSAQMADPNDPWGLWNRPIWSPACSPGVWAVADASSAHVRVLPYGAMRERPGVNSWPRFGRDARSSDDPDGPALEERNVSLRPRGAVGASCLSVSANAIGSESCRLAPSPVRSVVRRAFIAGRADLADTVRRRHRCELNEVLRGRPGGDRQTCWGATRRSSRCRSAESGSRERSGRRHRRAGAVRVECDGRGGRSSNTARGGVDRRRAAVRVGDRYPVGDDFPGTWIRRDRQGCEPRPQPWAGRGRPRRRAVPGRRRTGGSHVDRTGRGPPQFWRFCHGRTGQVLPER